MASQATIDAAERVLLSAHVAYLKQCGWERTCNTPGSFWMWVRDFADIDEERCRYHPPKASPFLPYGRIMATTEIAIEMSRRCLGHLTAEGEPDSEGD